MNAQIDLFKPSHGPAWDSEETQDSERRGWERRVLSDLQAGPLVYCYPGFMGAVCERLVASGRVTREPAGFMDPPKVSPQKLKAMEWRAEDHQLFRYSLALDGDARGRAA